MEKGRIEILEIHRNCLSFLLDYQSKTQDFYFVPRKNNNKKRLEKGMCFRGNDGYMVLSFWDSTDSKEAIYNISFCVDDKGHASIELSCRDDEKKLVHIAAIKELLEEKGKDFTKSKKYRWRCFYPKDMDYLEALQNFVLNEKTIIDNYVLAHQECGIPLANKELDDKYVKKLPYYQVCKEAVSEMKKTGAIAVKASEYVMKFQHNQLSNELVSYLKSNGYSSVITDEDFVDIKAVDDNGKLLFFELKTGMKVKSAIREAIGQLLEYNHYPDCNKAEKLIIVTMEEASKKDIQYLCELRKLYKIPVYYQQFDMEKKVLLEEC